MGNKVEELNENQIKFTNDEVADIDTNLNIKKLMFINRDFNTDDVMTVAFNAKGGQDFNLLTGIKAVYIAYRMANMNDYISYESFSELWNPDFKFAMRVYSELIQGKVKKSKFQETFKTKKQPGASSSQN